MKVKWHGMCGTQHSWAFTQQHFARAMQHQGHEVFIKSTNGLEHFPEDLKPLLLPGYHSHLSKGPADFLDGQGNTTVVNPQKPEQEIADSNKPYDLEIAYTIPYQGPRRFSRDSKCKAIIWNFESSILPYGWPLYHKSIDYFLPSSKYCYDMFAENGVPEEKMKILPLGVDTKIFNPDIEPFELKTKKRVKFLHNAIPHHRKLHERVIRGYINEFSGKDDVCLVLKTKFIKDSAQPFEVDVEAILNKEFKGKKNPPEIEIVNTWIPNISSLYNACDVVVSMSSAEGFWLPGLEALACEKLIIAPRHGGQLDFLNDDNALLIDTGEMPAPASMQYWGYMEGATVGDPSIKHYRKLMRRVYENTEEEKQRIVEPARAMAKSFTWERGAEVIANLPIKEKPVQEKKKVLYIVPYKMAGGGEVWVRESIKRLNRNVFEPHIALIAGTNDALDKVFGDLDVNIEDLSKYGREKGLKPLVESGDYTIIHFYNSFFVYNILKHAYKEGLRCRIVETVHSELNWNDSMQKVAKRESLITAIHAVSHNIARSLLKKGNKNVIVLPQPIDWERFNVPRSKAILEELNIPTGFTVGFIGRLSPEKNIPVVLECAKAIPDASFVIVGDGPQSGPLKQMASELKNVFFVGRRTDTEKFYAAFDLLLLPSTMEGLPLVILEAMAAGTPSVASDVGAIQEVVFETVTGSLVWNPGDPALFVNSINLLKANKSLWKRCSDNCKAISKATNERVAMQNVNTFYNMLFKR